VTARPLLFLDVDGPLLPFGGSPLPGPGDGLPDLPVVTWPEPTGADEGEDQWFGLCWKTRTLVNWADGRPFAWVDDEVTDADRDWVSEHHPGPALLRTIDASCGLADQDFAALDAWLRELP
jgi:hypothetical protein